MLKFGCGLTTISSPFVFKNSLKEEGDVFVRTILSENHHDDGSLTRRYVMETIPIDENSHLEWRCDSKLVELKLSLSSGTAIYFQDIPYTLAEAIWVSGIQGAYCCYPFCCADYHIQNYEQEAYVDDKTDWESRSAGEPIILDVYTAWDELAAEHRLTAALRHFRGSYSSSGAPLSKGRPR